MFKDWNILSYPKSSFSKSHKKIDWLINLVSAIRSTKVDLDVSPGSFIDISVDELNSEKKSIINDNSEVFRRLARISNIYNSKKDKKGVKIIVGRESITLYFDKNLNLFEQKEKILKRVNDIDKKVILISKKVENKSFLKNAPKEVVEKEKKSLIEYKIEVKKLNSILNSIKN